GVDQDILGPENQHTRPEQVANFHCVLEARTLSKGSPWVGCQVGDRNDLSKNWVFISNKEIRVQAPCLGNVGVSWRTATVDGAGGQCGSLANVNWGWQNTCHAHKL